MAKIGQNGDKHGPRKQVDVVGPPRPIGQRRSAPPSATLALCHVSDLWELLQKQCQALIQVGLHRWLRWSWRGSTSPPSYTWRLQPTLEPPYWTSFGMCWLHNRHWEPANTIWCKDGASKGRLTPLCHCPVPPCLHRPPCCLQVTLGLSTL